MAGTESAPPPKYLKKLVVAVSEQAEEFTCQNDIDIGPEVVAEVSRFVCLVAKSVCCDIQQFAAHGKRSIVAADDVLLLARKCPNMKGHLETALASYEEAASAKKRRKQ
eukprot:TRINITY_DN4924_c0_g1_i1.p1 TRINITY_DN4924_c0_g1~~TRINITY_DN4924_c0_g1_i1.p1  ORF type:complete len:109 (+),score=24.49 TRINITY_DN4924_c0_g1_i1:624-950(+)